MQASVTTDCLTAEDRALLRRFEPILAFNRGEQFYPMDIDRYLAGARLRVQYPHEEPRTLVERGQLNATRLAMFGGDTTEAIYFLNVADPVSVTDVSKFRRTSTLHEFRPGPGRLVRVGLLPRFIDLLFSLALLVRGRAPGGLATGVAHYYYALQAQHERYAYYGRVVREGGYIVLQYWFFYAFNDWRASYHGVNDHEGDWELVAVYASEDERGEIYPYWLACSAHDEDGDDVRRRWDDPALERWGDHPMIYPGAGSHANYFCRGEYMPAVIVPYTGRLARAWLLLRRLWARLGQGDEPPAQTSEGVRIPFVDYARGDGLCIGPGQQRVWEMYPLQAAPDMPGPAWVNGYDGLWGLYSGDPHGENGPPGPKYEVDGNPRRRWYDPLGWCGLDRVPPQAEALPTLEEQQSRLRKEHGELSARIADKIAVLAGLEAEAEATRTSTALHAHHAELQRRIHESNAKVEQLKADRAANELTQDSCARLAAQWRAGDWGDPHAHLHNPALPLPEATLRLSRLAAIWGGVSVGVLLLGFAVLSWFSISLVPGVVALIGVYAFMEALFHRNLTQWLRACVVALALLTLLILLLQFYQEVLLVVVVLVGVLIIVDNLREVLG
jgi:hypothetical protein